LFYSCDGQDSIKIYIKIDNDEKELANTCGKKMYKSGPYDGLVVTLKKWRRKLVETACEYMVS
jgi:hypothetical protein